jgi:hypothetical protein
VRFKRILVDLKTCVWMGSSKGAVLSSNIEISYIKVYMHVVYTVIMQNNMNA